MFFALTLTPFGQRALPVGQSREAAFLGLTTIQPGRFNAIGSGISVYFLATGVAGLELLGAQDYVQSLFYGVVLVIAVVLSRLVNKRRVGVS
jgi:ribose transport system permease protein